MYNVQVRYRWCYRYTLKHLYFVRAYVGDILYQVKHTIITFLYVPPLIYNVNRDDIERRKTRKTCRNPCMNIMNSFQVGGIFIECISKMLFPIESAELDNIMMQKGYLLFAILYIF